MTPNFKIIEDASGYFDLYRGKLKVGLIDIDKRHASDFRLWLKRKVKPPYSDRRIASAKKRILFERCFFDDLTKSPTPTKRSKK